MKQLALIFLLLVQSFGNPLVILGGNGQAVSLGTDPGTTGLLAKYNFADASDSHGSYTLTETNSPTYSSPPSHGVAVDSSNATWAQDALDNVWTGGSGSRCFALRFRGYGAFTTGSIIAAGGGSNTRFLVQKSAGGLTVYLTGLTVTIPVTINNGTWYVLVATTDGAGNIKAWIDGANETTNTGTHSYASGAMRLGGDRFGNGADVHIDYAWFASAQYTADNAVWFYNNGETR